MNVKYTTDKFVCGDMTDKESMHSSLSGKCFVFVLCKYCFCRLRAAKILLIGMQGLGAEIAKNLILSGVHSITFKDHTDVSIVDRCSQFFIPHDSEERNVSSVFNVNFLKTLRHIY